ncbi:MAG: hypothetical protein ACK4UN_02245 [Limisphaerales bacterium]
MFHRMLGLKWLHLAPFSLLCLAGLLGAGCLARDTGTEPAGADSSAERIGFHSRIESSPEHEKWVLVDLGHTQIVDEVTLVPVPVHQRRFPGTSGIPRRFIVELSNEPHFRQAELIAELTAGDFLIPDTEPFRIIVNRQPARFVRITAKKLDGSGNEYFFALSEMRVISRGRNIAERAEVLASDSLETEQWSTDFLVDGRPRATSRADEREVSRR